MTFETNHVIANVTFGDWLKSRANFSSKTAPWMRDFPRALNKLRVISVNSDWFIAPFAIVVIGRSNYIGIAFSTVIWKPLYGRQIVLFSWWKLKSSWPIRGKHRSQLFIAHAPFPAFRAKNVCMFYDVIRSSHHFQSLWLINAITLCDWSI